MYLKIIIIFVFLVGFYYVNASNYSKQTEIKQNLVKHPENLPTKETAISTAFGFRNLRADIYWLETIQYIGSNAISSEYKKYLYNIIDLVTELDPYFKHPYIIGQLLLPSYNERYEKLSDEDIEKYQNQAIEIGLKGIKNFCPDSEKLKKIIAENDLQKIWTEEQFKNPCSEFIVPYYLAYVYYFYKNDPLEASKYYKIASANTDSLSGAKVMAAIMQGKGGNREKSFFMFLNLAKYMDSENNSCIDFSKDLENIGVNVFLKKSIKLDGKLLRAVEKTRLNIFGKFDEEKENEILSDAKCGNYVNKAIRELNLAYIEEGNKRFMKNNPNGLPARQAKGLLDDGFIDFLPTDFQQYDDYGIIYEYNYDTKNYDYSMGNYD